MYIESPEGGSNSQQSRMPNLVEYFAYATAFLEDQRKQ